MEETDDFTSHQSRLPGNGDFPYDVGKNGDETNKQVGRSQVLDKKVHTRLATLEFLATIFFSSSSNFVLLFKWFKSNFFSEGIFLYGVIHFYKVNIHFFCIFLNYFSKHFLLNLNLFRHNSYYNKNLLINSTKNW